MANEQKNPLDDPRVTRNEDGTLTVQLQTPVKVTDGEPMTAVTLTPLSGLDMISMLDRTGEGSRIGAMVRASALLCGPKGDAFLKAVSATDFLFLGEVVGTFLGSGQTTGQ